MKNKFIFVLGIVVMTSIVIICNVKVSSNEDSRLFLKDIEAKAMGETSWHYTNATASTEYCDDNSTSYTVCESDLKSGSCDAGDESDCPGSDENDGNRENQCDQSPTTFHVWTYGNGNYYCKFCYLIRP